MTSYYQAPADKIFNEVKREAIKIWGTYDDTYGYVSEKVEKVNSLKNIEDNLMFIVGMFDLPNQIRLSGNLSNEARKEISDRLISVRYDDYYNVFKYKE